MNRLYWILLTIAATSLAFSNPNPPTWPSSVKVYTPSTALSTIVSDFTAAQTTNGGTWPACDSGGDTAACPAYGSCPPVPATLPGTDTGEFSTSRFAFLFQPGTYDFLSISEPLFVGYYMSVIGLGVSMDDTIINGVTVVQNNPYWCVGSLNTFWRSAENFKTVPNATGWFTCAHNTGAGGMLWAGSQACPLRRIHVTGANANLFLFDYTNGPSPSYPASFASGGFLADCVIDPGSIGMGLSPGSQQQFMFRNSSFNWVTGGAWSFVFLGCTGGGIPATGVTDNPGGTAFTNILSTPWIAEKPYISYNSGLNKYYLQIPNIEQNKVGADATTGYTNATAVDFENVYVSSSTDSAATINAQIALGNHIILTPGIYSSLGGPITVTQSDITILGIGFPTLVSLDGASCIVVSDSLTGVRIGGILLDAGTPPNYSGTFSPLLQWGTTQETAAPITSASQIRGFLYDLFCRVGGEQIPTSNPSTQVRIDVMVQINSANVICDNQWLWRADHATQNNTPIGNQYNPCNTAFEVYGDNISCYGLAVEHTLQNLTLWAGNNGSTYFYQAEYPYDATSSYEVYSGYNLQPKASITGTFTHSGYGMGTYCYFRDNVITMPNGFYNGSPTGNVTFMNLLTRYLTGNGGITNVINTIGNAVNGANECVNIGPNFIPNYPTQTSPERFRQRR